ncbi:type II toxin-antitoxin system HicB family antitoxin [Anaerobium acetethylicum]|uniref:Predicted nuclease of the RNAse H fold, HicB family n=1 Tax=Anaerobium acetethylicum TaxID=1619234 RepID=A0A1D3TWM8_9FIRM|nr:type II toxin-antitoxin system HicB family antitoxin [Anaerobium acetethylicum]SCP98656.1 Predicted nuclease of the RNAse H fold, HicB family [Anaerobium acetethylicum]
MKNKLFYPAIFEPDEDGAFTVFFPDVEGCVTGGSNMEESYELAFDCLGLVLSYLEDNKEEIPAPSKPQDISLEEGQFLVVIEFDMMQYKKKNNSKAVKKTLSIPEWLNEAAIAQGINFSQVLQEALMTKLAR